MCYEVKIHWSAADYTDLLVLPGKEKAEEEHEEQERKKQETEWNKNFEVST